MEISRQHGGLISYMPVETVVELIVLENYICWCIRFVALKNYVKLDQLDMKS
jgi:hypothetical protein